MIKVGVFGAGGRMGATVCAAVLDAADCELVAAVDPEHAGERVADTELTITASADAFLDAGAEVGVDFTVVAAARENLRWCAAHDVHAVVGTTGITEDDLDELTNLFGASRANAFIAPNFAIGAVLMMEASKAAQGRCPVLSGISGPGSLFLTLTGVSSPRQARRIGVGRVRGLGQTRVEHRAPADAPLPAEVICDGEVGDVRPIERRDVAPSAVAARRA